MNRRAWIGVLAGIHLLVAVFFTVALVRLPSAGCGPEVYPCEDLTPIEALVYAASTLFAGVVALVWCPLLLLVDAKGGPFRGMVWSQVVLAVVILALEMSRVFYLDADPWSPWWPFMPNLFGAAASLGIGAGLLRPG